MPNWAAEPILGGAVPATSGGEDIKGAVNQVYVGVHVTVTSSGINFAVSVLHFFLSLWALRSI